MTKPDKSEEFANVNFSFLVRVSGLTIVIALRYSERSDQECSDRTPELVYLREIMSKILDRKRGSPFS